MDRRIAQDYSTGKYPHRRFVQDRPSNCTSVETSCIPVESYFHRNVLYSLLIGQASKASTMAARDWTDHLQRNTKEYKGKTKQQQTLGSLLGCLVNYSILTTQCERKDSKAEGSSPPTHPTSQSWPEKERHHVVLKNQMEF